MEMMRILQYVCSVLGTGCLIFTYVQMAQKKEKRVRNK